MSSDPPNGLRLRTLRPILLGALSAAYTVYLVQNADPRLRNSAVWLPVLQILVLWILADPVRQLLNRPGGKWSVSWMPAGLAGGEAKGENGWAEAMVQGGLVSVASFAWRRTFVGLDAASAVAFLSLTISLSNVEVVKSKISLVGLISLVSTAIAIAIAASTPVISLHLRAYSLVMCIVHVASSWYIGHRFGTDPATAVVKTMSGRKTAIVAVAATVALTILFAVNGKERRLPSASATMHLAGAAVVFALASLSSTSPAVHKTCQNLRQSTDTSIGAQLAGSAVLLCVVAISSSRQTAILLAQAFVFGSAAAIAWMSSPESPSTSSPSSPTGFSRTSSSATLAVQPEHESDNGFSDKRQKADGDRDVEGVHFSSNEHKGTDHQTTHGRLPVISGERWRMACFGILLLPILAWIGRHAAVMIGAAGEQTMSVKSFEWPREADYDIVVAYYDEDKAALKETIASVKSKIREHHTTRTIVYAKGPDSKTWEGLDGLRKAVGADEVVALKNVGREGETYLNHITRHYDSVVAPLAHQTFFIQPHFAWDWIFTARLEKVVTDATGFVSFGPYLNASCTADGNEIDSHGQSHPRIAQIYSAFQGDLCPADGFTITWAGQFMASRQRIQSNKLSTYQNLLEFFHVPKLAEDDPAYASTRKEWIWREGWWNSQPSDPTLGHAVERSWCAMMQCSDVEIALKCQGENDSNPEFCQCRD